MYTNPQNSVKYNFYDVAKLFLGVILLKYFKTVDVRCYHCHYFCMFTWKVDHLSYSCEPTAVTI